MAAKLPSISPKYQIAVDEFKKNGGDKVAAYLTAYPNSMTWSADAVERNADRLFAQSAVQQHITGKIPKRRKPSAALVPEDQKKKKIPPRPPSKLDAAMVKKIVEYAEKYKDTHGHPFPSVVGLATVCKVTRQTIYDWCGDPEKGLLEVLPRISTVQHAVLLHGGYTGEGNASITRMILERKHGYEENQKIEHTVSGPGGGPIQTAGVQITANMDVAAAAQAYRQLMNPID